MNQYIKRKMTLSDNETFFLWGMRQTGKSTLLKQAFKDAFWIDLLKPSEYRRYTQEPDLLIEQARRTKPPFIVIDEIQKVPDLLDAVHWIIENVGCHFALCGSSARKVRQGKANLLGGRGVSFHLYGFSAIELGKKFDLLQMLNHGYIPNIYLSKNPMRLLNNYVAQYLKEEIAAEGIVRRLPSFSEFLNMASLSDTEVVNYTTIARDTGVSSQTIKSYFDILDDTLVGRFLQAYRRKPKRRVSVSPKFYFSDIGIVNYLANRKGILPKSELFGKAFENWIFHELSCYNAYKECYADFYYWRLTSGVEVDFIVNHIDCAIEAKATYSVNKQHLKGLRHFMTDHPETKKRIIVSLDEKDRMTDDGIEILHYQTFLSQLWRGNIFS
jgi:predicted AAA+ superfamily ATPase